MSDEVEVQKNEVEEEDQWLVSQADPRLRRKKENSFTPRGLWVTFPHPQAEPITIEFPDLPDWEEMSLDDRALLIEIFQVVYLQTIDHDDSDQRRAEVLYALRDRNTQLSAKKLRALLRASS